VRRVGFGGTVVSWDGRVAGVPLGLLAPEWVGGLRLGPEIWARVHAGGRVLCLPCRACLCQAGAEFAHSKSGKRAEDGAVP